MGIIFFPPLTSKSLIFFQVYRSLYLSNGEWDLEDADVFTESLNLPDTSGTFPVIGFTVKLRRKPTYFVLNVIVPRYIILYPTPEIPIDLMLSSCCCFQYRRGHTRFCKIQNWMLTYFLVEYEKVELDQKLRYQQLTYI